MSVSRLEPGGKAKALDDDDAGQVGPLVALLQPGDIVDDGDVSGLDASVIAIDGLMATDGGVLEILGFLLGEEQIDILPKRTLITLQGQDVIGFLVDDLLGDGALAAHGVDGHHGALDGHHPFGNPDQGRHPGDETALERLRVQGGENVAQVIVRRRALRKGRNRRRTSSFFSPNRAMSVTVSAPASTARRHSSNTSGSGYITFPRCRGSGNASK